jgi:hypothetical protein
MPEFRYHDELPAFGTWPGGKRYGYHVERQYRPRTWSDGDRERAHALGITLPDRDVETYESWWDQPERVFNEIITYPQDLGAGWWRDPDSTVTFEQRTITARQWRRISWSYVPPWGRREPR